MFCSIDGPCIQNILHSNATALDKCHLNSTKSTNKLEHNTRIQLENLSEQFSEDKVGFSWIPSGVTLVNPLCRVPRDPGYKVEREKKTQLTMKGAVVGLCHKMYKSSKCAAAQELLI